MSSLSQAVKLSADPRNSADFHDILVIPEISVNLVKKLESYLEGVSQELHGLQKWFTYRNLQNFISKTMGIFLEIYLREKSFQIKENISFGDTFEGGF